MSTILSVYCENAFEEYLLPAVNNSNHTIELSRVSFGLPFDLSIQMEVVEGKWSFRPSDDYLILYKDRVFFNQPLHDNVTLGVAVKGQIIVTIVASETNKYFKVFDKYRICTKSADITIGEAPGADIQYSADMVSKIHAVIHYQNGKQSIEDCSTNGTFVNNHAVGKPIDLRFGDSIDIFGMRIVSLGELIAIGTENGKLTVNSKALQKLESTYDLIPKRNEVTSTEDEHSLKRVFRRSPRYIPKIETSPIEIDAAPSPKELNQPSLILTLGPSLTMALPMLLGCAMSIWATQKSGMGSSVFMYTGLVTAISSALLGTVWGFANMRRARRTFHEEEKRRAAVYGEYLKKCEKKIKERYDNNAEAMHQRYRAAEDSCAFTADNTQLWNRNMRQDDFMLQRIGIGNVPFQSEIVVPKERFNMISDELMERPAQIREKYRILKEVPACIDLLEERLIGIVGDSKKADASKVLQCLVSQVAANNCYTDVKMAFVYDESDMAYRNEWDYARWLPHVWNETKNYRYIAKTPEEAGDVFYELMNVLRFRAEDSEAGRSKTIVKPQYIVIVSNPSILEGELISSYLFNPRPEYGFTTIILSNSTDELPNECEFIIQNDKEFAGFYHVYDGVDERSATMFDTVSPQNILQFAKRLANIEVRETESGGDIPDSLSFFDMYGINRLSELNVIERWRKNRTYESMRVPIGERAGGAQWFLDIHEKYHGPHGLVAGTTGSGKSETLQTYILSLAVNFSPDDIGFFIIDYKGGGMANLFKDLPHTIGSISNLSGNQVNRAMVSIKSENLRRQRIFNEYEVNNINSYTKLYKKGEARIPIPHMFIIIDEFAELKREESDFMQELISVAQVGRSLGVHLILATQKPSGTVDDNIWSNSKFRLCLRVQDKQDSNDMLHRPDAANITLAGRCYMQVGNDELFELFQSAWSGATFVESGIDERADIAKMLATNGTAALEGSRNKVLHRESAKKRWIESLLEVAEQEAQSLSITIGTLFAEQEKKLLASAVFKRLAKDNITFYENEYNERRLIDLFSMYQPYAEKANLPIAKAAEHIISDAELSRRKLPEVKEKTQLEAITEYLYKIAEDNGYHNRFQLWMPVLSDRILLLDLMHGDEIHNGSDWPVNTGRWSLRATVGKYDDPENQAQDVVVVDFANGGNVAVCGAPGTGKSTFLQTLLFSLIIKYSPEVFSAYIIDFNTRMLDVFDGDAHIGGIVHDGEDDKIDKLFTLLSREVEHRRSLFKGGNYEQYVRAEGRVSLPAIILAIDDYTEFRNKTDNAYDGIVNSFAKTGGSYGIYMIIAATGFGTADIPSRLAENLPQTYCLEMNDRFQYTDILREMHLSVYPEENIKGRGLTYIDSRILEFQTAIAYDAEDDYKRGERIAKASREMSRKWNGGLARQIPVIPVKPIWEEYENIAEVRTLIADQEHLPIGYNAKTADIYAIDLRTTYTYTISGRRRTGKTNLLKALMLAAARKGSKIVVIDMGGKLEHVAEGVNALYINSGQGLYDFFKEFINEVSRRVAVKQELVRQGSSDDTIYQSMLQFERICFFVSDLISLTETIYSPGIDVPEFHVVADNIIDKGALHNMFWFASLNQDDMGTVSSQQFFINYMKNRKGIHLGGNVQGQRLFTFDFLSYIEQSQTQPLGHGLIPSENDETGVNRVVVPLVKGQQ